MLLWGQTKRHAAARRTRGALAGVGRLIPTWQEVLLWSQTKRYAAMDALGGRRGRLALGLGLGLVVCLAVGVGLMSGFELPYSG